MSIIKATRTALNMTQAEFAVWLSEQIGHNKPLPVERVSEWENGKRMPRKNIRDVCIPIVAGEIASEAIFDVCALFKQLGISPLRVIMSSEAIKVKDKIKNRIIAETD